MDCQENETSDVELIQRAEELYGEERLLKAAEVLELVLVSNREKLFTEHHWMILKWADVVRKGMHDLLQDPEQDGSPWIKQRETHGHRDFLVFYQLTDENQLIARIDCAFEASLVCCFTVYIYIWFDNFQRIKQFTVAYQPRTKYVILIAMPFCLI
jgi:hypothetical protein